MATDTNGLPRRDERIPRATLPESPFRFIVIDDPVQSMDPARVDGLDARMIDACPTLPQLICLREYLGDPELAGRLQYAWADLSRACHHHPYELPPAAGELGRWLESVELFIGP